MASSSICGFVDAFLKDLHVAIDESTRIVTGDVENSLHQKLESCGDKRKQARQLNAVAKCSNAYMHRVQAGFNKNFDKFELYMRRNIVMIPHDVIDDVEKIHQERLKKNSVDPNSPEALAAAAEEVEFAGLSPQERREKKLEKELVALRKQIRELQGETQRLTLEEKALEFRTKHFKGVVAKLDFLEQISASTIKPLKRTVEKVAALHESLQVMDEVQTALEEDTKAFKRKKMETRDTYRNLHQRFLTQTANVGLASLDDLKALNANLSVK
ncbi:hypothetical protein Poli38472_013410 [Pythium oligandrum]|uniref:Uncharacterized protein n=1 Tax=Pythium oligandrum TaxID=41045 RepID=A0A8K1C7A3_PYTOL|nr:hypothetical protein Poli38472_013410 [Pythium oligandrum]|eukprot:TMW57936.1 hypothetical protein Poli38472_013410 [Pythium oligandrum]